jgi:hypothetical protein
MTAFVFMELLRIFSGESSVRLPAPHQPAEFKPAGCSDRFPAVVAFRFNACIRAAH